LTAFVRPLLTAALAASVLISSPTATADADHGGSLVVHRNASGVVDFISAPSGGVDATRGTRMQAAWGHLDRVAAMLGIDDPTRDLEAAPAQGTVDGGSVVRFQQRLSGLPVLGGEVVIGMDADQALTSVAAHRSKATTVAQASYDVTRARRTARLIVAKADRVKVGRLAVTDQGTWAYDGSLLGASSPGARSVYRFEVGNGSDVRELVLVDAVNGRVLLHFNQIAEAKSRYVCDDDNVVRSSEIACSTPYARIEGGEPSTVDDVNQAYDLIGATHDFYDQIGGLDLTTLIGMGTEPERHVYATVRWCESATPDCPMQNAFWNGSQMYFGQGYSGADDVVGHELTHGVIQKYANLFYFHESGAINESLADVMGEIIDHRNTSPSDAADDWRLGEDLPGGALRNLADPTAFGQPDKMTSSLYAVDPTYSDNGGVHTNSGIGNKTAYLISQGGSFNGYDLTGIDAGDPALTKTATLYTDVIEHLVSGSQYDDLGRVLVQSCQSLAQSGTAGFSSADCDQVLAATQATELSLQPTVDGAGRPAEAPDTCPDGRVKRTLSLGSATVTNSKTVDWPMWVSSPNATYGVPANSRDGAGSLFGFDPDPHNYGDPYWSRISFGPITLPVDQPTYFRFDQWRLFEWTPGTPATFNDGGLVRLSADDGTGTYYFQTLDPSWWDNGPQQDLALTNPAAPTRGFGGDSNGWTSSRLNLSAFAGKSVRPSFTVAGDGSGSYLGWFLDGIELYTCDPPPVAPSTPNNVVVQPWASRLGATLTWSPPVDPGSGVAGYRLTRSDGKSWTFPVDDPDGQHSVKQNDLAPGTSYTFGLRALGVDGLIGPAVTRTLRPVHATIAASATRVKPGATVVFKGKVTRVDTGAALANRAVNLQYREPGSTTWRSLPTPNGSYFAMMSRSDGTYRFAPVLRRSRYYRVLIVGSNSWFYTQSGQVHVTVG